MWKQAAYIGSGEIDLDISLYIYIFIYKYRYLIPFSVEIFSAEQNEDEIS